MTRLLVMGLLLVVACTPERPKAGNPDQAIAEMEPKVGPRLAALEAARKTPPPADAPPFPTPRELADGKGNGDTLLIYADDITELAAGKPPPRIHGRHLQGDAIVQCWVAMRQKQNANFAMTDHSLGMVTLEPLMPHAVKLMCDPVAKATYAAVVGVTEVQGTTAALPADVDKTADTYTRGKTQGVIDLYQLADGKFVGRRTFGAASSASLTYKTDTTGVGAAGDLDTAASADLYRNTQLAIEATLRGK